jgi:hypothetical protein
MVHGLLEIMEESLARTYRKQFLKAVAYIRTHFIPKVRQVTPPEKGGSLARLELYFEKYGR